ncbi:hypothetical protein CGH43_24475 [Vibrio parahaemolyticus]|nr:hypothetical protein [Vibrio parahaemolyticus]AKU54695.1 hypothetical protein FORC8_1135 [Vibrio parahaemolyticus]AKU54737.1 hypothetical protein FORC8_1177 [Vibrio parahaemolyticus]MCR9857841.1 hypothetical protein [Vibrio parahaemolyticus]TOM93817.1 hypothetical protein CGH66_24115 [Vibrio parahaemolyticus]TOO09197.1 hypothetical protein CGH43_24475 [Vibrio parahaemolyticus]
MEDKGNKNDVQVCEQSNNSASIKDILITAVITSLLSVSGSYWLVSKQLEAEQGYWIKREKIERIEKTYEKQVSIMENVNYGILTVSELLRNANISSAAFNAQIEMCKIYPKSKCDLDAERTNIKYSEYFKEANRLNTQLQIAEWYFGNEVRESIKLLDSALKRNYQHKRTPEIINEPMDYFKVDFNSISEIEEQRAELINLMRKDISESAKFLIEL